MYLDTGFLVGGAILEDCGPFKTLDLPGGSEPLRLDI